MPCGAYQVYRDAINMEDQLSYCSCVTQRTEAVPAPSDTHTLLHLEATEDFKLKSVKFASQKVADWFTERLEAAGLSSQQVEMA